MSFDNKRSHICNTHTHSLTSKGGRTEKRKNTRASWSFGCNMDMSKIERDEREKRKGGIKQSSRLEVAILMQMSPSLVLFFFVWSFLSSFFPLVLMNIATGLQTIPVSRSPRLQRPTQPLAFRHCSFLAALVVGEGPCQGCFGSAWSTPLTRCHCCCCLHNHCLRYPA